ncbi:MAG TPA: SusD/RagB family nutrient-binding outer membrane lipoprotein [Cyclobacteriaceae bacterium]|nr:SusD/RagB family nutrient-binding outer membrane lipoprotein [Cyclobacteriaceae bacterium]
MKNIKIFSSKGLSVLMLSSLALVMSCTSDFENINTNKNNISTIGPAELPFLFSKAQSSAPNSQWNYQVAQNLFADQYCQYFACEATYFGSDRLVINQNWVGAAFNPMYTDVLPQLQTIFENSDPTSAEYALANIWWVYTFHRVTDYWGPIPYFSAGQSGTTVPYDPQDQIYYDFFDRLADAVQVLKGKTGETPYGSYDIVYGGDVNKWIKFANTLRLRLAMRISSVDPTRAKTEAEAAVADGVMTTSPGDDALVQRSLKGSDGNGLSIMQWNEFRMSASMESVLKGYDDPRMPEYYLPSARDGEYHGLRNGLTSAQLTDASGLNDADYNSQQGPRWSPASLGGVDGYLATPQNVMCTAEAYFLRAEGVLKGWNMGAGTAKDFYESGIKSSFLQWGITADPTSYINSTGTPVAPQDFLNSPPMTDIPVLFGATPDVQEEQIATQKWIALYPDGMEAWSDYRRSHKVKLYPVANSDNPLITDPSTQWLRRIPFLTSEKNTNKEAVDAAVDLLEGPDDTQTPLWWDKN